MNPKIVNLHWNKPYDVYVGRGKDPRTQIESPWGNPFTHLPGRTLAQFLAASREDAVAKHRRWFADQVHLHPRLPELHNKTLGCWCAPAACHATTLAEFAYNYVRMTPDEWEAFLECVRNTPAPASSWQPNLWSSI